MYSAHRDEVRSCYLGEPGESLEKRRPPQEAPKGSSGSIFLIFCRFRHAARMQSTRVLQCFCDTRTKNTKFCVFRAHADRQTFLAKYAFLGHAIGRFFAEEKYRKRVLFESKSLLRFRQNRRFIFAFSCFCVLHISGFMVFWSCKQTVVDFGIFTNVRFLTAIIPSYAMLRETTPKRL